MTQPADKMPDEIWYSNQIAKNNGKEYMLHFTTLTETSENKTRYIRSDLTPNQAVDGDRGRALSLWKEISESYSVEGECRVYRMDEGVFDMLNDALIKALKP